MAQCLRTRRLATGLIPLLVVGLHMPTAADPHVVATAARGNGAPSAVGAEPEAPATPELAAVGQLLAEGRSCTASVIGSRSGRLAITAAHCVYIPPITDRMPNIAAGRKPGWIDDLVFVPARTGDEAPYGIWSVDRMWVDRAWQNEAVPELDVALIQLRDAVGGTAQDVLGSLGITFDASTDTSATGLVVDVIGYPVDPPFDGTQPQRCPGAETKARLVDVLEARCDLTAGASGGPWLVPDDGWWSTVAVTSYRSIENPDSLAATRLTESAEQLWLAADATAVE